MWLRWTHIPAFAQIFFITAIESIGNNNNKVVVFLLFLHVLQHGWGTPMNSPATFLCVTGFRQWSQNKRKRWLFAVNGTWSKSSSFTVMLFSAGSIWFWIFNILMLNSEKYAGHMGPRAEGREMVHISVIDLQRKCTTMAHRKRLMSAARSLSAVSFNASHAYNPSNSPSTGRHRMSNFRMNARVQSKKIFVKASNPLCIVLVGEGTISVISYPFLLGFLLTGT